MKRTANPELDRLILNHLSDTYKLKYHRPEGELHLSTLIYCLTKAFWEAKSPSDPTDEELMLFALGYGLQDVLTPKAATTPIFEKEGIIYRPDFLLELAGYTVELKTTRQSLKKAMESLPETWLEYIMGGCYIRGISKYELSTLFLMGNYAPPFPKLYSETLEFDEEEMRLNWCRLIGRKDTLQLAFSNNNPPEPFKFCKDWECKNCRYRLQCDTVRIASTISNPTVPDIRLWDSK